MALNTIERVLDFKLHKLPESVRDGGSIGVEHTGYALFTLLMSNLQILWYPSQAFNILRTFKRFV